ncbi:hypothetical protein BST97_14735 [Nonlabens spongiae]|uniref:Uncharacterized protein n=1 Tax=Nonlabens spongiae TaxID=331648 RepID=A0A1W6MNU4_9FLAO|nr:hypothetical protein [Nonlabens spongiae]ARN79139.1 hypothetical protein BST97_14735 [Nonlabens spongiae]
MAKEKAPYKEVEIKFPENKTITLKSGMLCKLEIKGMAGNRYEVEGNWYFRNSSFLTSALVVIYIITMNLILMRFDSQGIWKYVITIIISLLFFVSIFNFFSKLCKFELVEMN